MKRWLSAALAAALMICLAACGRAPGETAAESVSESEAFGQTEETAAASQESGNAEGGSQAGGENDGSGSRILVAYFSWSGNTEEMASYIAEQTGGDLLEIQPETPYPTDYNECGEVAQAERDNNERPAIANLPASIEEYDAILIGYPIWWHTAPMIIGTFLESYDLSGVDIYPFSQSASMDAEQFDNSMAFIRESAAGATVYEGLFVSPSDTDAIDAYLSDNGLIQ